MPVITLNENIDILDFAKKIKNWLDENKMETKAYEDNGIYIIKTKQTETEGLFDSILGNSSVICIKLIRENNNLVIDVRFGKGKLGNNINSAEWQIWPEISVPLFGTHTTAPINVFYEKFSKKLVDFIKKSNPSEI